MLFGSAIAVVDGPALGRARFRAGEAQGAGDVIETYRALTLHLTFASILIATLLVLTSGVAIDTSGTALVAQLLAGTLLVAGYCAAMPRLARLADLCGTLGLTWLAGLAGGVISLMGLRLEWPLADHALMAADRLLGIDGPQWIAWLLARTDWPTMVTMSYNYTVPVLCLSLAAQSLAGRRVEAWRAAFCFTGSLLAVCLISILTPAKGLGVWLPEAVLVQLPGGAARYFWPSFDQFYGAGSDPVLTLAAIDGVVSFPSFHTIMGLITLTLWRHSPIGFGLAFAWFVQMMVGTMPLGGHYFADLLAGAALWAGIFALSRRIERTAAG